MNVHIHPYKFDTDLSSGHNHVISGYTVNTIGTANFHFHTIMGVSSYNDHFHRFSAITGFSIKTAYGHIHKIEGNSALNKIHKHSFCNFTSEEISSGKNGILQKTFANT